jgi:hypothetical protein
MVTLASERKPRRLVPRVRCHFQQPFVERRFLFEAPPSLFGFRSRPIHRLILSYPTAELWPGQGSRTLIVDEAIDTLVLVSRDLEFWQLDRRFGQRMASSPDVCIYEANDSAYGISEPIIQ